MLIKPNLFLRNAEDGSPGGGSVPPAPPAPANNGAAPVPTISVDQLKEAIAPILTDMRNGIFADLRKAGALGKEKPTEQQAPAASAPAQASGPSLADMERIAETKVTVAALRTQHGLNDAVVNHLKAHLEHSKPSDVFGSAQSFLSDLGLVKAPAPITQTATTIQAQPATAPPQTPPPPAAPIKTPVLGAPAPGDSLDVEALIASQPLNMSGHDFDNLVSKVGRAKAESMVQSSVNAYLKTVRLVPDNRRRR